MLALTKIFFKIHSLLEMNFTVQTGSTCLRSCPIPGMIFIYSIHTVYTSYINRYFSETFPLAVCVEACCCSKGYLCIKPSLVVGNYLNMTSVCGQCVENWKES